MSDAREGHLRNRRHLAVIHVHPEFDFDSEEDAQRFINYASVAILRLLGSHNVMLDSEVRPRMRTGK